jgi:hypothetical protein
MQMHTMTRSYAGLVSQLGLYEDFNFYPWPGDSAEQPSQRSLPSIPGAQEEHDIDANFFMRDQPAIHT